MAASPVSDLRRHEQQELSVRYSGSPVEPKKNTVIYRCEEKPGGLPTAVRTSGITKAVSGKISIVCVCVDLKPGPGEAGTARLFRLS